MKTGRVFLVGAGPGDPALLTEQGRKCLEQADAVVYDALACSSVLNLTKPDCSLIFAGKMAGNHYKKQSETNRLLVELAEQGKQVVRLKGGDPFVFGRGGEEAQVLQENGIPFSHCAGCVLLLQCTGICRHPCDAPGVCACISCYHGTLQDGTAR